VRISIALAVAALLVVAAPARAGTARVQTMALLLAHSATQTVALLTYTGAPGERNDVRVTGDAQAIRIEDAGAPPIAGAGCAPDGPSAVRCTPPAAAPSLLDVTVAGTVVGVENAHGGAGRDVLAGDDGPNELVGSPPDAPAGDTLIGRGGRDTLEGGTGADTLLGGPGADELIGWGGADRYDGGPGADRYDLAAYGRRGSADVRCSNARDLVALDDAADPVIHSDCPRVVAQGVSLRLRRRADGSLRALAVRAYGHEFRSCRVRLAFGGVPAPVVLRVSAARDHVAAVRSGGCGHVTVSFAQTCSGSFRHPVHFRLAS
jgi:RTX calcium-binding nonapeptide repeat (4 copies)